MVAAPSLRRLTVAQAVESSLEGMRMRTRNGALSKTTLASYERDMAEFIDLAGPDTVLDDLTPREIDHILDTYRSRPDGRYKRPPIDTTTGLPKTRNAGSQARFRQSLVRLFNEASTEGWVELSPMPRSQVKPKTRGMAAASRSALREDVATGLLEAAASLSDDKAVRADQRLGLRDTFLLRLLLESGPRVSEVSSANRPDLSIRPDGTVWLRVHGKGNKVRDLPMSPQTHRTYLDYIEQERPAPQARIRRDKETGEPYEYASADDADRALLLTWRGLRMQPRDIQLAVERHWKRLPAELRAERGVTPHGLRHTAATLLLASGAADVHTVKELLGHASIATTGIYLDSTSRELSVAVANHPVTGNPRTPRRAG